MDSSVELLISRDEEMETELKFEQGGVSQKFAVNGKRRNQSHLVPGKLFITENRFGDYLEWKPVEQDASPGSSSPFKSSVLQDPSGIGYSKENGDSVEFLPDPKAAEYRRPIRLELAELRSYMIVGKNEIIFIHSDGSTLNPFVFERGSPDNFIAALERCVGIAKSKHTKNLYMIGPKDHSVESPNMGEIQGALAELFPEQVNHLNNFFGFVKEFKNDPYAGACTVAAKIGHFATNGELPGGGTVFHVPRPFDTPKEGSPSRTSNDQANQSFHSDGMDADYTTNEEGYEVIFKPEKPQFELPRRPETFRGQPLSQEQWLNYMSNEGRVSNMEEIKKIIFQGGVDSMIRTHVWPFLLGVYDPSSTYEERRQQFIEKTCSYNRMKLQWATITEDQEDRFHTFRDFKSLIEKDVARTDRALEFFKGDDSKGTDALKSILMTYMMYNFNLGYVQGMSDILAPILMEIQDEVMTFWLFAKFMDKIHTNFEMSQEGMQKQLRDSYTLLQLTDPRFGAYLDACDASNMYFAFRWLLIWFKREFTFPDVLILWESLWTGLPGPNFQLFIGLSILIQHRSTVMENKFGLSEILRHVNDLSMRIDLEKTLSLAESLFLQVTAVEDKLPNQIREIIGLPPRDDEEEEASTSTVQASPAPVGEGDQPQRHNTISSRPNGIIPSDSEPLESHYELGVTHFM